MTLSRVDDSLSGKIRRMLQSAENIDALSLKKYRRSIEF